MSSRLDVLKALKALVVATLPAAEVLGLDGDEAPPARVPAGGLIVVRSGDPGDPEVDLSPLAYNWSHRIPVEVTFPAGNGLTNEEAADAAVVLLGLAIQANRQLGGLCDWLDAAAPATENLYTDGAEPPRAADLIVTALYSTSSPTG